MPFIRTPFLILIILAIAFAWHTTQVKLQYHPRTFGTINITPQHNDTLLRALQSGVDDGEKERFIKNALRPEFYDLSSLRDLCDNVQWTNNVIFTCDNNAGGIGNVRNHMLNCIRYAIEAGGSLVMPRIIMRNNQDIVNIYTNDRVEMDYLFDVPHFKDSLQTYCPQLQIYSKAPYSLGKAVDLLPESLDRVANTGLRHPSEWRKKFDKWFKKYPRPVDVNIVHLSRSYLSYPIQHDPPAFSENFGHILRFRVETRRLAAAALYSLHLISTSPFNVTQTTTTISNLYLGAHLRTETDALHFWSRWPYGTWTEQTDAFIQQAIQTNLSLVYVASGEENEILRFKKKAGSMLTIISKKDLLGEVDRKILQEMTFDQQALVDFLILMRASSFGGVAQSSFTWNIALKRHVWTNGHYQLDSSRMLSDKLSTIYGWREPKYEACMWP